MTSVVEHVGTNLIQWPEAAKVDRVIPKERLYTEASAGTALRQRFVDEVQRVRWAYKLGEESLRLAPSETVTEIQVFVLDLKGSSLDNSVLASIDKAIPSQIIFELRREDGLWMEQVMAAAYKRADGKAKGTDYFRTGWIDSDQSRDPLPAALNMDGLYSQLLGRLLPHPIRPAEELSDALDRMGRARKLIREVAALEKKLRAEPQLNRKIEIRRQIKERAAVLTELTDPVPNNKE
ncbi:protein of unknown function [Microlunatus sagamiharensis]|uniref:Methyl-accepting chemotaxis protein n=1 Tax=Microlunatus sagamiharensis TaxID=546874 RepID=A0A1H2LJW6_9ACTN|nr:DUF4391 domain-containing protein [Microlunatus sagamiharensis]SDU81142.1 protein of unknown function [Microlunatus sagamiharensis]